MLNRINVFSASLSGIIIAVILLCNQLFLNAQVTWLPTADFSSPGAINVYCLSQNYEYCNYLAVGGAATTSNYPLFTTNDDCLSWNNIGPTPQGTVYALAKELSTASIYYACIRSLLNPGINGLYKYQAGVWSLIACSGLDVRGVTQRYGTIMCGVKGSSHGIYKSDNGGSSFSNVYQDADIYCFEARNQIFYAAGFHHVMDSGIVLRATDFPSFTAWTTIGYVDGSVIGLEVTQNGTIWLATSKGYLYKSTGNQPFSKISGISVNYDELYVPMVSTMSRFFYGDSQSGIWVTSDGGVTWFQENDGLPSYNIRDMIVITECNQNRIYAAVGPGLSNHIFYFDCCLSYGRNDLQEEFISIYPNPIDEKCYIAAKHDERIVSIKCVDIMGRELSSKAFRNDHGKIVEIEMSYIYSGVYFIIVATNTGEYVFKVIKN